MNLQRATTYVAAALALILAAEPALANAGTTFILASMVQLSVGNFFLGMVEAGMLLLGCRLILGPGHGFRWRQIFTAIGLMVAANYASALCGFIPPPFIDDIRGPVALYGVRGLVAWSILWAYLLTLVVEFPFVLATVVFAGVRVARVARALGLHLVVQTATNLVVLYFLLQVITLPDPAQIDASLICRHGAPGSIIYLAPDGHSVRQIRLDGTGQQTLLELAESNRIDQIELTESDQQGYANIVGNKWGEPFQMLIPAGLPLRPPYSDGQEYLMTHFHTLDLRPETERGVTATPVYGLGLRISDAKHRENVYVDAPTGGVYRLVLGASVALPGDHFVFQMGPEIAIYSWAEKKLAVLVRGRDLIYVPD